jgi:hypothetical protein
MRLRGVGACVGSRWQTATASPRPPLLIRGSNRFALPPLTRPTNKKSREATPPAVAGGANSLGVYLAL